jgi:predicted metal-dependent phosphotriesterase family hydrolase
MVLADALWSSLNGSPGLSWLYSGWSKKLKEFGLSDDDLHQIFVVNPTKALTFS